MSSRVPQLIVVLSLALAACDASRDVAIQVRIPVPDDTGVSAPVPGVAVVALPYDRDSVLAALEAGADRPRPHIGTIDSVFAAFRGPFNAFASVTYRIGKLQDTLTALKASLDTIPRGDSVYTERFRRFVALSDSLSKAEAVRDRAATRLAAARATFVPLSDSLRRDIRAWENTTFAGYDTLVTRLARARGREPMSDTTDVRGWTSLHLLGNPWWIYARAWDPRDPNAEWYWNVRVDGDTVVLGPTNGASLPKY